MNKFAKVLSTSMLVGAITVSTLLPTGVGAESLSKEVKVIDAAETYSNISEVLIKESEKYSDVVKVENNSIAGNSIGYYLTINTDVLKTKYSVESLTGKKGYIPELLLIVKTNLSELQPLLSDKNYLTINSVYEIDAVSKKLTNNIFLVGEKGVASTGDSVTQLQSSTQIQLKERENKGRTVTFTDLPATSTHWAKDNVYSLVKAGIVYGSPTGDGKLVYKLDDKLTRNQFTLMLSRTLPNVNVYSSTITFPDVKDKSGENATSVQKLHEFGVISGYTNGLFGFSDSITREQTALMLVRYLKGLGIDFSDVPTKTPFTDVTKLSAESQKAIGILYNLGIVDGVGDNKFSPSGTLTRAAMAKMLDGVLQSTIVDDTLKSVKK